MRYEASKKLLNKILTLHDAILDSSIIVSRIYLTEEVRRFAYQYVIEYAIINDLIMKDFDFERYRSDKYYLWYKELHKVLEIIRNKNGNRVDDIISPELVNLFDYIHFRIKAQIQI